MRLSRLSDTGAPLPAFLDMRRVRDRIYRLLDRRLWPREQADLYFLLGCLNGLMGITANRLGYPDAAEELIRAGWAYANAIDHRPLQAQLRQQLSYIAYWRGRITRQPRPGRHRTARTCPKALSAPTCTSSTPAPRPGSATPTPPARRSASRTMPASATTATTCWRSAARFAVSLATHHALAGAALAEIEGAEREAARELERCRQPVRRRARARRAALVRRQGRWPASTWPSSGCAPARWTPPQRRWSRSWPCPPAQRIADSHRPG